MQFHTSDTSLEAHLATAHVHIQKQAQKEAKALAQANKPAKEENNIAPYINSIQAKYNGLISYCNHHHKAILHAFEAKQVIEVIKANPDQPPSPEQMHSIKKSMQQVLYAKSLETQIVRMYEETIAVFMADNLIARPDAEVPACFHTPPPKLRCLFTGFT